MSQAKDYVRFDSGTLPGEVNEAIVAVDYVLPQKEHTATIIFLHGSGDQGTSFVRFARQLNERPKFKHVKWVLPSAKTRRSTGAGMAYPLWFDITNFKDLSSGPWDEAGIMESVEAIHGLVRHEMTAHNIPPHRIVLAGLSQGSATAVWSALTFADAKLAGVCALAGRLPAPELLQPRLSTHAKDLPFYIAHSDLDPTVPLRVGSEKVVQFLKDVVGLPDATGLAADAPGIRFKVWPGRPHFIILDEVVWKEVGDWLEQLIPVNTS